MSLSDRINDTYAMPLLVIEEIRKLEQERDAMAAHVERLEDIIERSTLADSPAAESALEDTPETSLARLKAQWQAEELERLYIETQTEPEWVNGILPRIRELRRQAEGGEE